MKFSVAGLLLEAELRHLFRQPCFSFQTTDDIEADDDDDDEDSSQGYFWGNIKAHNHRHHLLYYKEIKSRGRKESKE